jgi:diguanylate cyclase (GGDEF)-like protein/PAS domain S-box-containing protein
MRSMKRLLTVPRHRPFLLVGLLVAALYLGGWFDKIERDLIDLRAHLHARPASGELVVVAIDPASLQALNRWPWPRRYHAEVLKRLLADGARRVAFDIDFSSPSTPEDDRALAEVLATTGPDRVALAVHRQWVKDQIFDTAPLLRFRRHVSLASINVQPDPEGLIRGVQTAVAWGGGTVPTMPAWLAGEPGAALQDLLIDFSIDPTTIPTLSFVDVLAGRYDPAMIAGKSVLVGAAAIELGDWRSVPGYRALPGPLLQALAFETLIQDRALRRLDGPPIALASALLALLIGPWFLRLPWRQGLILLAGSSGLIVTVPGGLQPVAAWAVDTVAPMLGLLLAFSVAILLRVERQARALVGQIGSLPATDDMMRQLVDSSFDAIITFANDGRTLSCNRAAERIFDAPGGALIGAPVTHLLPDRHGLSLEALAQAGGSHELCGQAEGGRRFPVEATFGRIQVDEKWVGIAILRDITERKAQQAELERMALHDALTGLPNRTLFNDRIERAISAARRAHQSMAVLLLDLDRFKDVNDTLGHDMGDLLLTEVGPRLQQPLRETDTVARLGGDEFAILLPGPTDLTTACRVAERIVDGLRQPFDIRGLVLEVGVSIGVALYPEHGQTGPELLQHADVAMYAAKRGPTGFVVYRAESDTNSVRQLTLTGQLRRAIEDDQMLLEFQPKIDARTTRMAGVEALIRWQHPELGAIPPDEFIHSAEQTGLIKPLTLWVMNAALRELRRWAEQGLDFSVAVNLSVKSLQDPELPEVIRGLLDSWQQRPERLTFEITESALMADPAAALEVLERIAAIGCKLSLDDFGTGYSSLAYLQKLPINELKIDRSFVMAMTRDDSAAVIVRAVVKLAKGLRLGVVAEGVESEDTFERLRALGCDQMQGYWFGPAMTGDQLLIWLKEGRWQAGRQAPADRIASA